MQNTMRWPWLLSVLAHGFAGSAASPSAPSSVARFTIAAPKGLTNDAMRARRLQEDFTHGDDYIWGACGQVLHNQSGCGLHAMTCSHNTHEGPEDHDVAIRITGLPPTVGDNEVHVSFWAARRSDYPYKPLVTAVGAQILPDIQGAYARFDDADHFNGGNVRVDEEGVVVIRARAPAAYRVGDDVYLPHIHFRLCSGVNFLHAAADSIMFTTQGVVIASGMHSQTHGALIKESVEHAPPEGGSGGDFGGPSEDELTEEKIKKALNQMSMKALEFSPVYQCLLGRRFYDTASGDCVQKCADDKEEVVGQCVAKPRTDVEVLLKAAWHMKVLAGDLATAMKDTTVALHHVRLAAGSALQIPFQEVVTASLYEVVKQSSRRLELETGGVQNKFKQRYLVLEVEVRSKRVYENEETFLQQLITDPATAEFYMGFKVAAISNQSMIENEEQKEGVTITNTTDPFNDKYEVLADRYRDEPYTISTADVPVYVIILAVAGFLCVPMICYSAMRLQRSRHRRRGQADAQMNSPQTIDAEAVGSVIVTGRRVEGDGPVLPEDDLKPGNNSTDNGHDPVAPSACQDETAAGAQPVTLGVAVRRGDVAVDDADAQNTKL